MSASSLRVVYNPEVIETLLSRLPSQFRDKARICAYMTAIGQEIQGLEDRRFDLVLSRTIELATGVVLEQWGALVGESRGGLSDTRYRQFILARLAANRADGSTEALLTVWVAIMGDGLQNYGINGVYPASYVLWAVRSRFLDEVSRGRARRLMADIKPGGVSATVIEASTSYFGFAGDPNAAGFDVGPLARQL